MQMKIFAFFVAFSSGMWAFDMTLEDFQNSVCPSGTLKCEFDGSCCNAESQFCDPLVRTCNDAFPKDADKLQTCCREAGNASTSSRLIDVCYFKFGKDFLHDKCAGTLDESSDRLLFILTVVFASTAFVLTVYSIVVTIKLIKSQRRSTKRCQGDAEKPHKADEYDLNRQLAPLMGANGSNPHAGSAERTNRPDDISLNLTSRARASAANVSDSSGVEAEVNRLASPVEEGCIHQPMVSLAGATNFPVTNVNETSEVVTSGCQYTPTTETKRV
ncbi:uncharacterized protein LOC131930128 [Physella acuta]|uniref:uncharacterized protein LOC131930128 n=1 Tax=Physella acuta TaxID=109671 RepID=UPI0027DE369E|nr:uncharacterized protein LOC131930128 [Physella acuta]